MGRISTTSSAPKYDFSPRTGGNNVATCFLYLKIISYARILVISA
jgi:hypothetical protein